MSDPSIIPVGQIGLPLTDISMKYLADCDMLEAWKARGISAHSMDHEARADIEKRSQEAVKSLCESDAGKKRIQDFGKECASVVQAIQLGNYKWLDEYLGDRQFLIISGLHRTGGSYLLDELSKILNYPYQEYHAMHDDLPTFFPVLYRRMPHFFMQYLFELAQFLVIVRQSVPWSVVVKKRAVWTLAIDTLSSIFRERGTYFVHVRHPISWAWADTELRYGKESEVDIKPTDSMKQYVQVYDTKLKYKPDDMEYMLRFWRLFCEHSAQKNAPIQGLAYGDFGPYLEAFALKHKPEHKPVPFTPTPRDYGKYERYFEQAEEMIQNMNAHWDERGLNFPKLRLI